MPTTDSPSRYQFLQPLGTGGSGIVYLGFDRILQRKVAIKRLRAMEGGPATALADLQREAGVLSQLHHPNIVTVLDFGGDAAGPFVVMEYLEGTTLHDFAKDSGPLMEGDFLAVARQCLDALVAAQAQRLLHRDLKPGNVMLNRLPSGLLHATLLDFGLAKFVHFPSAQTASLGSAIMGTVYFMAPEQFRRQPLDVRTDLYSLGCVFYFALTGHYPFTGDKPTDVIKAHQETAPEPLENLRPDLPVALCRWVAWLMEREASDRPRDAAAALERLHQLHPVKPKADADRAYFYSPDRPLPKVVPLSPGPGKSEPPAATGKRRWNVAHVLFGLATLMILAHFLLKLRRTRIEQAPPLPASKTEWFRRELDAAYSEGSVWVRWHQPENSTIALARGSERVLGLRLRESEPSQCIADLRLFGAVVKSPSVPAAPLHVVLLHLEFGAESAPSRLHVWMDPSTSEEPDEASAHMHLESSEPLGFDSILEEGSGQNLESCNIRGAFADLGS